MLSENDIGPARLLYPAKNIIGNNLFFMRVAAIFFFDFQAGVTLPKETGTGIRWCFLCTIAVVSIVERQI